MRPLALLVGAVLTGCSSLLVHPDDPTAVVVTKTLWRGVLGVSTLGLSEIHMSTLRDELNAEATADQRLQDYEAHLTYLVNNGALSQAEAENLYQRYSALVFQETLAAVASGDLTDYWIGPTPAGYLLYGAGGTSVTSLGVPDRSVRLRSGAGYQRRLGRFGQPSVAMSTWDRSRASSSRWSRVGLGGRSYFRGAASGKGSGRRGGRR